MAATVGRLKAFHRRARRGRREDSQTKIQKLDDLDEHVGATGRSPLFFGRRAISISRRPSGFMPLDGKKMT
jgi:hypothetical protein